MDLLWKPLIRMFRRYLKKDALPLDSYESIREESYTRQGYLFCRAFGLPDALCKRKQTQMAVLLMVSSHRIVWKKSLIPICAEMMKPYLPQIWPLYFKIFNETSHKQRVLFYAEPLIQHLWGKFRATKAVEIKEYMEKVRRTCTNVYQHQKFLRDIC